MTTTEQILAYQKKFREFAATPLGEAFLKFERAHTALWQGEAQADSRSHAWLRNLSDKERDAKAELMKLLYPLSGVGEYGDL